MKIWAATAGATLILIGMWLHTSPNALLSAEVRGAFNPLVSFPWAAVNGQYVEFSADVPDDVLWRRIRRLWGDPEYIVAAVSPPSRHVMYCLYQLQSRYRLP